MITELEENQVFVFGSNILGNHAGGAAKQAHESFGAAWGVGEGLTGGCYAFPTLDKDMQQYTHTEMVSIRDAFYRCCVVHPEMTFLLTPVGTGIANLPKQYIKQLFKDLPTNVQKVGWKRIIDERISELNQLRHQNNRNNRNSVITAHPVNKSKNRKPTKHNYKGKTVLSYTLKPRSGKPPLDFIITDVVDSTEFKIVNKPSKASDE